MYSVSDIRSGEALPIVSEMFQVRRLLPNFTFSRLVRLTLITALLVGAVLTSWVGITTPVAAAAAHPTDQQMTTQVKPSLTSPSGIKQHPQIRTHAATTVNASQPYDGLGDLSFYSYISKKLTNQLEMKVNVADGNLLLHASVLQIHGTGLDLGLDSYFNSYFGYELLDDGVNWRFGFGRGVSLDLSNISSGINLYGPSGYTAFFAANGSTFQDPPGLNATLSYNSGANTYTLSFHRSGNNGPLISTDH